MDKRGVLTYRILKQAVINANYSMNSFLAMLSSPRSTFRNGNCFGLIFHFFD